MISSTNHRLYFTSLTRNAVHPRPHQSRSHPPSPLSKPYPRRELYILKPTRMGAAAEPPSVRPTPVRGPRSKPHASPSGPRRSPSPAVRGDQHRRTALACCTRRRHAVVLTGCGFEVRAARGTRRWWLCPRAWMPGAGLCAMGRSAAWRCGSGREGRSGRAGKCLELLVVALWPRVSARLLAPCFGLLGRLDRLLRCN